MKLTMSFHVTPARAIVRNDAVEPGKVDRLRHV